MADKLEMPNSIVTRLIKDGASQSLSQNGQVGNAGVILSKDTKQAFQQLAGYFVLYLSSM